VLRKGDRTAEARTRRVPAGPQLRIHYNGAFLRSEVVRDGCNLDDVAEGFSRCSLRQRRLQRPSYVRCRGMGSAGWLYCESRYRAPALGNCLKLDGRGRLSRNPPARPAATPHSVAARVGHCVGCRLCVGFRRLPTESPKVADRVADSIEPAVSAVAHDASHTSIAMLPGIGDGHRSIETGSGECAGLARAMFRRACAGPVDARRVPFLERSGP
jgi:hypothetical protein